MRCFNLTWRILLPIEMDPQLLQFCLLVGLAFSGVILLALAVKMVEVYRARNWQLITGTVTKSQVRARKRQTLDEGSHFESEPLVTYEYELDGKRYRGTRISFAERISGAEVGETLARYPVGKSVLVYYNPANPNEAVLEHTLPPDLGKGVAFLIIFFLGAAVLIPVGLTWTSGLIAPFLPHPERAFPVTILGGMIFFCLLLAYAIQKQVWTARGWSVAAGRILVSDTEEYQEWESREGGGRWRTMFRPSIVYSFTVNGQQYISDRVSFGGQISASAAGLFKRSLAKYPPGSAVSVYYDPQNPTESVLERNASGIIVLWVVIVGLCALAVMVAGFIG